MHTSNSPFLFCALSLTYLVFSSNRSHFRNKTKITQQNNTKQEVAKPYIERVAENPTVGKVVGTVRDSAVGVGSMVSTTAAATKQRVDRLRGNTPEAQQAQAEEAEAWRAVLHPEGLVKPPSEKDMAALFLEAQAERIGDKVAAAAGQVLPTAAKGTADGEEKEKSADFDAGKEEAKGGAGGDAPTPTEMEVVDGELSTENVVEPAATTSSKGSVRRGEEMTVPARTRHTSFFFVEKGATLSWSFRVAYLSVHLNQPLSIGFAVKLRIQGDGGSSEVQIMFQAPLCLFLDTN